MSFNSLLILSLLIILPFSFSELNGQCSGRNGICVYTSTCAKFSGTLYSGYCPNDSNDIKCCDSIKCTANGQSGKCMFISQCSGTTYSNLCPGGNDFKCCVDNPPIDIPISSKSLKDLVTSLLLFEEGVNPKGICVPYIDSLGYPTIGYGQLCKSEKVTSLEQANAACSSYTANCSAKKAKEWLSKEIDQKINCIQNNDNTNAAYTNASNYRKAILISMAFQLGCGGIAGFKKTLSYMANGDWANAATEMLDSLWARQTPNRANRHSYVIKNNGCGNFCKDYGWN